MYTQQFEVVFRYLLSLTRNTSLAEELTQETFYKAMKGLADFEQKSKASTWLCQIARNTYESYWRKNGRLTHATKEQGYAGVELSRLIDQESAQALHNALHSLAEPYKEVFTLRVFAELSYGQIATLFGNSENWARVTFYRAKSKIKQVMEEDHND